MCRLAAFPPKTSQEEAHSLLDGLQQNNIDGVGTAYVQGNQFMVHKYPWAYHRAVNEGMPLFAHMPHNGWTIAHVRFATVGDASVENTHPFIKGNYCIAHNGSFRAHNLIRETLRGFTKFVGESDSEIAAYLIHRMGPSKFYSIIDKAGVYFCLNRDGRLTILNTGGDLDISSAESSKVPFFASRLPIHYKPISVYEGIATLMPDGEMKTAHWKCGYQTPYAPQGESRILTNENYGCAMTQRQGRSHRARLEKYENGYLWKTYD